MTTRDEAFPAMQARSAALLPRLDERARRVAMATEATSWGRGGISTVARATAGESDELVHQVAAKHPPVGHVQQHRCDGDGEEGGSQRSE